jgi:hypothetical protein
VKTTVLFDVDGVFNVWPAPRKDWEIDQWRERSGWYDLEGDYIEGYWIAWAPQLVERVNALTENENVELRWLTTWCDLAARSLAPRIGLKSGHEWRIHGTRDMQHSSLGWWKALLVNDEVKDLIEDGDKVIWIDDDHPIYRVSAEQAMAGRNRDAFHVFTPLSHTGITAEMMDEIEAIIAR